MSVTFSPSFVPTGRTVIVTLDPETGEDVTLATFDSYADAQDAYRSVVDTQRPEYGASIMAEDANPDAPSVNMANSRAVDILIALDLDTEDLCGAEDGATFYARTLIALAQDRDEAAVPSFRDGNMVVGGRREGYVTERLTQLLEIADYARAKDLRVVWG